MMYYGSRLRPVEEVVSEAMEAEDFSVVNHYLTFLLAHACDTQDYRLRRQCDLIKTAHGKPPFKGSPTSSNNLPQQRHLVPAAVAPNQIFIKNYNGKPTQKGIYIYKGKKKVSDMKKQYLKPTMMVYRLKTQSTLLAGSPQSLPLGDPDDTTLETLEQW